MRCFSRLLISRISFSNRLRLGNIPGDAFDFHRRSFLVDDARADFPAAPAAPVYP